MSFRERIVHAILFEFFAILLSTAVIVVTNLGGAQEGFWVSFALSVTAMLWNFVFNWIFDKFFTGKREERSMAVRVFHTLAFEGGLLIFTVPMVVMMLNMSVWQAFLADIGITAVIVAYTFCFNWLYDHLRLRRITT